MKSNQSLWAVRVCALAALAVTVWLCGPRAAAVLAARFGGTARPGPSVILDRVGVVDRPAWLQGRMLLSVAESLSPWLSDEIGILDEDASRRMRDGLLATPWVREVRVERVFPDRFRLHLKLRQPILAVLSADDEPLCVVDESGVMLPWADADSASSLAQLQVPKMRLFRDGGNPPTMTVVYGAVSDEPRVHAAAAIVKEWREQLAPLVENCPALLEVDATNLGERWAIGLDYPEIRVHLQRRDGEAVVFAYGRPVDSNFSRVPVRTKATVLAKILGEHQQLGELVAGDLRFARRWIDYLQPRKPGVQDPRGPWTVPLRGSGR